MVDVGERRIFTISQSEVADISLTGFNHTF